jgi:hypothetical protein
LFGFLILKKKIKSQEFIPEIVGEDHGAALLRRQVTRLGVGACISGVEIDLVLREWIRVSYITYYEFN